MPKNNKSKRKNAPQPPPWASTLAREATNDQIQTNIAWEQKQLKTTLKVPSLPLEQGRQLRKRTIPLSQSQIDALPPEPPPLPINTDDQGYILANDKQLESEGMSSDTANDVKRFFDVAAKELNEKGSQLESNAYRRDNESYMSPVSMADLSLQVSLDTPSTTIPLPTLPVPLVVKYQVVISPTILLP